MQEFLYPFHKCSIRDWFRGSCEGYDYFCFFHNFHTNDISLILFGKTFSQLKFLCGLGEGGCGWVGEFRREVEMGGKASVNLCKIP